MATYVQTMHFHLHLLLETTINKQIQDEGKAFHFYTTLVYQIRY